MAYHAVMDRRGHASGRLFSWVGVTIILALSLALLGYVAVGEANRGYPRFALDRLAAQGEVIENAMMPFLQAGLPLEQFPGFLPLTQPLLDSDPTIAGIAVVDPAQATVFLNAQPGVRAEMVEAAERFQPSPSFPADRRFRLSESPTYYRVEIPLTSRFEQVGTLAIFMPKAATAVAIGRHFQLVAVAALGVLAVYAVAAFGLIYRGSAHQTRWLGALYAGAFLLMAAIVTAGLVNLYADGVREKTRALANSLSARLRAPIALGLDLTQFSELDTVLVEYQRLYPELSYVALTDGDRVLLSTDPGQVGDRWSDRPNTYNYTAALAPGAAATAVHLGVRVGIPESVIYEQVWRGAKNFAVLFIAAAFIALLLFQLLQALASRAAQQAADAVAVESFRLRVIAPFYFLAVFVEALAVSFLPQHLQGLARGAGVDTGAASALFTLYFAAYGLSLIPASRYAERGGLKRLLIAGIALTTGVLIAMALVQNFWAMIAIRALAGLGQGLILAGVQTYILEVATPQRQTQGAGILVFGYNSGMIAGTALGALLAVYMGVQGVFVVAAAVAALVTAYALVLIPTLAPRAPAPRAAPVLARPAGAAVAQKPTTPAASAGSFWRELSRAFRDLGFVKAVLLIGVPSKIIIAGVTIFAIPLLLARQNYPQEDIGQVVMFYSGGVLLSNTYIARRVDRTGATTLSLFLGNIVSGVGLILIGLMGLGVLQAEGTRYLSTVLVIVGMAVLGIAHGFITAPAVTHVTNSRAAEWLGRSSAAALYRFLERGGQIIGPLLVGQWLVWSAQNPLAISQIGIAIILMGILFVMGRPRAGLATAEVTPDTRVPAP